MMLILWAVLIAFLYCYVSWIVMHELSHYIMAKILGYKVLWVKMYPHKIEGRRVLGSVCYKGHTTRKGELLMCTSPLFKAMALLIVFTALSTMLPFYTVLALLFVECSEIASWFEGYYTRSEGSDGNAYRNLREDPTAA